MDDTIYSMPTEAVAVVSLPELPPRAVILPGRDSRPAIAYELPRTRLDHFLPAEQDEREFRAALIWIFIAILLSGSVTTLLLLFAH